MDFLKATVRRICFPHRRYICNLIPYVLIGGGTASYYASLSIRARDPEARVLIISDEKESPYRRSHLSKEFWWYDDELTAKTLSYKSPLNDKRRYACYESDGFYLLPEELEKWEHGGVALMCSTKVQNIDMPNKLLQLENGQKINFGKCLIATGSIPLHQQFLKENPEINKSVSVLGNAEDYHKLYMRLNKLANTTEATSNDRKNIVIVGGGLLGAELAYSLNRCYSREMEQPKFKIIQIAYEQGILADILPNSLQEHSTDALRSQGIEVLVNTRLDAITSTYCNDKNDRKIILKLASTQNAPSRESVELICDHLVLAIGAVPNIELAEKSGLKLDEKNGGVLANEFMQVQDNLWAAGDLCSFFDATLGYQRRSTHWQNAQITGRIAGENMTLGNKPYTHQGAFVTMLGPNVHICGIGNVDPQKLDITTILALNNDSEVVSEAEPPRAVTLYTDPKTQKINGVMLYNVHDLDEEIARKLITDARPLQMPIKEYAKLFELWQIEKDMVEAKEEKMSEDLLSDTEIEAYQTRED